MARQLQRVHPRRRLAELPEQAPRPARRKKQQRRGDGEPGKNADVPKKRVEAVEDAIGEEGPQPRRLEEQERGAEQVESDGAIGRRGDDGMIRQQQSDQAQLALPASHSRKGSSRSQSRSIFMSPAKTYIISTCADYPPNAGFDFLRYGDNPRFRSRW